MARFLFAISISLPLCSQQVSYSLFTIPAIGHPKQFHQGVRNYSPETLISKTKNNSLQKIVPLDERFSVTIYLDARKQLDSIHVGFDDKNSNALGERFFVRESGDIFRLYRSPGGPRIRVLTQKVGDLEQPTTIEFVDNVSIELESDTSTFRKLMSFLPHVNRHNYMLRILAGSRVALVP